MIVCKFRQKVKNEVAATTLRSEMNVGWHAVPKASKGM